MRARERARNEYEYQCECVYVYVYGGGMRCEHAIEVEATPERAFGVVADVEGWPRFMSALDGVRIVDRSPGAVRVEMREAAGRLRAAPVYRVEFDAPRGMRALQERGLFRSCEVTWTLRPAGGRTRVAVLHRFETGWPLAGSFVDRLLFAPWVIDRVVRKSLRNFKRLVETGKSAPRRKSAECSIP